MEWKPPKPPKEGFSAKWIASKKLQARGKPYEIPQDDAQCPGLRLRVQADGTKTFRLRVTMKDPSARARTGEKKGYVQRAITIGTFREDPSSGSPPGVRTPGLVTLAEARDWTRKLKLAHKTHTLADALLELRVVQGRAVAASVPASAGGLVAPALEEFYTRSIMKRRKTHLDVRRLIDHDILPMLGMKPLGGVKPTDCAAVVRCVVERGAPSHAGKVLATLRQFFRWAESFEYVSRNPAAPLSAKDLGIESDVSDRFLSDEEIPIFLHGIEAAIAPPKEERKAGAPDPRRLPEATALALRVLLLTGARSGELLKARWEHVDLEPPKVPAPGAPPWKPTWTIPVVNQKLTKEKAKRAKPFVQPLSPQAEAAFKRLKELAGTSPWAMASEESHDGRYSDKALCRALRRLQPDPEAKKAHPTRPLVLPGGLVSPHDLRRTARTHLALLGVHPWIAERVLNHALGKIEDTYNRHDYLDERRDALARWGAKVEQLETGRGAEVVAIRAS